MKRKNQIAQIPEFIIRADLIKAIDVIWEKQIYPARTIVPNTNIPNWIQDYKAKGPAKYMDMTFDLVMIDNSLYQELDFHTTALKAHADAIIISTLGNKVAIKDATVLHCLGLNLTLLGGIFALKEDPVKKKSREDQTLKRFQMIDLSER